jgi:trigger factor
MQVTTERLEDCQVNVIIEMDAGEIDKKMRQTARKISRQFTVPGYRKGRAPFHAVIRVFGREAVQQEALEDFGQDLYEEALEEIEYEPYQPGELQDVEWDPFRMTVLLPTTPEVDLGDYRAVRVPFEMDEVTDEDVEEYLANLQQEHAQWVPAERPAALGDQVVINATAKIGDEEVLGFEDHELEMEAETADPLPGFHEEMVGMSAGEEKTFALTYPEDHDMEEAAGQEATFSVHLLTVKEEDLPPLDDDLAMMVGDYDTLDDLRASVRERLETEALQRANADYPDQVMEAMIEAAVQIEYPPQAIDQEAELALEQMERNLASSGIQLDTYLGMLSKTRETYKQELRPMAEERLKKQLVLTTVAEQEGLRVEEEEIEAEVERLVEMMGEQGEEMREMLEGPAGRLSVASDLMAARVQERIVQIGKGEAPPLEELEGEEEQAEAEAEDEAEKLAPEASEETGERVLTGPTVESEAEEAVADVEEQEGTEEAEGNASD